MPASLTFRDASSRDVFTAIARFANISLIFDPAFRDTPITVDLRNASLEDALNTVAGATRTFFRVTAPENGRRHSRHAGQAPRVRRRGRPDVLSEQRGSQGDDGSAAPGARRAAHFADDRDQRADDQGHAGADRRGGARALGDRQGAARGHHRRRAARGRPHEAAGVRAADRVAGIAGPGRQRVGEDRCRRHRSRLQALRNLSQSDILLAGLPSLYYRLLKTDVNTRTLANPQLRTSDGTTAQARFGEQVPVPVTTFAPIATGGTPQQPITSFNYQNIGVNIDITPRTHHDDDVSLDAEDRGDEHFGNAASAACRPSATARSTR